MPREIIPPAARPFLVAMAAGLLSGVTGSYAASYIEGLKHPYIPHGIPHQPTSELSAIVAETTSEIAEEGKQISIESLPTLSDATLFMSFAPNVPPQITRKEPARIIVHLTSMLKTFDVSPADSFDFWTLNDSIPAPFIRCRVGDVLEIHHHNADSHSIRHDIEFQAVTGPGGGASVLSAEPGETKVCDFRMLNPGLYLYSCSASHRESQNTTNGTYGLILVEPLDGLPPVEHEFFLIESEIYPQSEPSTRVKSGEVSNESPSYVLFNGKKGALVDPPLTITQDERVRLYVGNAGPNRPSSFHITGSLFDRVYREGDLNSAPARGIQTTLIPVGSAIAVEFEAIEPGDYRIVDHSIFRMDKGAVGLIHVDEAPPKEEKVYDVDSLGI
jgi:copper-containing nitrite reductase